MTQQREDARSDDTQASNDSDRSPEELHAKVDALRGGVESAWDAIDDLREKYAEQRELIADLQAENDALREEVARLDARTDLLQLVEESDELSGKQRSVALIQHLRRAAERERDRGRGAKTSVNREEAERALHHPDVDRTTIYDDMRRAVRLVGDERILWYESGSGGGSRLKLNLEAGEIPVDIIGQSTNHGGR